MSGLLLSRLFDLEQTKGARNRSSTLETDLRELDVLGPLSRRLLSRPRNRSNLKSRYDRALLAPTNIALTPLIAESGALSGSCSVFS